MGERRIRRNTRQADMAESRRVNGMIKDKERARRDARMLGLIEKGKYPYTPVVMSWLSTRRRALSSIGLRMRAAR